MTSTETPSRYRFLIEALLFLTYAAFGLSWIGITPLLGEVQAAFGVSRADLGLMTTVVAIAKVAAPLLTGLLALRIGLKRTILIGAFCMGVAALVPWAPGFKLFLAERFLFGIGGAMVVTLMGPMAMGWFPAAELPIVNALNNVAVNTGISITLFTTVPLAAWLGWRLALCAYGLLSLVLAVVWALFGRDAGATRPQATAAQADVRYAEVWRLRETWLIALAFTGPLALYLALNTWLPHYYVEVYGMDKATASHYTGLFNLIGIPTAIAAGFLTKQLGRRRPFIIGAGLLLGVAAAGMFLVNRPAVIMVSAVLLGVCLFTYVAPLFTIPMELPGLTPRHVSLPMATVFSCAYAVSALSPILVGYLRDATGSYLPGLLVWSAFSWVLAIAGALLPETGP
ncbi:MAG: MFS transporter, partial [Nevskia sp.]|nr:MFS transporter [Nevskia sp.]